MKFGRTLFFVSAASIALGVLATLGANQAPSATSAPQAATTAAERLPLAIAHGPLPTPKKSADDASIPAKCRPHDAIDNERCSEILFARFKQRNIKFNRQDRQKNEALKAQILSTKALSGATLQGALEETAKQIPFYVRAWHFVYSRSGTEYAVLEYGNRADNKISGPPNLALLFDYDFDDGGIGLENSSAADYVVWRIEGDKAVPCGFYAHMLALSTAAFVASVNNGRKGFDDSGYDASGDVMRKLISELQTDQGPISRYVDADAPHFMFYWNTSDGYVFQTDTGPCPDRQAGIFIIRGPNCEAKAAAAKDVYGSVLPFKVVRAIRNHGFKNGIVVSDISVAVDGGSPGDWMATGVFVAEHSIVRDATTAHVTVIIPNPWADFPPQLPKKLAEVYYDPNKRVLDRGWSIFAAKHAATVADIDYFQTGGELLDAKIDDPERQEKVADAAARKAIIRKYGLPKDWKSKVEDIGYYGLTGQNHERAHVHISEPSAAANESLSPLRTCLTQNLSGSDIFQGCMPPESARP